MTARETEAIEFTEAFFKQYILDCVSAAFGLTGAARDIDLLKYNVETKRGIIRVPIDHYVKVRSSLTVANSCKGFPSQFIVHKASPLLLSLQEKIKFNHKDWVIFATKEDHKIPSSIKLREPDPQPGLILPNGEINWNCPCLGGMATGPCGVEFRDAFSCFHYSGAEPKGSDCFDKFKEMQICMQRFPKLYNKEIADDDDLTEAIERSSKEANAATSNMAAAGNAN